MLLLGTKGNPPHPLIPQPHCDVRRSTVSVGENTAIVSIGKDKRSLDRLFSYLKRALFPPKGFLGEILEKRRKITQEISEKLEALKTFREQTEAQKAEP